MNIQAKAAESLLMLQTNTFNYSLKTISFKSWLAMLGIFCLIIAISLYSDYRMGYQVLSGDQLYYKIFNDILSHPGMYALDPIYSNPDNTRIYTPLFLQLINPAFKIFGYFNGLAACLPLISLGYLFCMFVLLYKTTGRVVISIIISLISGANIPAFPIEQWGALSLYSVMPRTLFLIFVPILFFAWLRYQNNTRVLTALFFICGLLTHLHPVSGVTFSGPLLFAQFYKTVLKEKSIKQYCIYLLVTALPMIPFAFHYFGNSQEGLHLNAIQFQQFFKFMLKRYSFLLPPLGLPNNMDTFVATLSMVGLGIVAFIKSRKYIPQSQLLILFCLGCCLIYVAFYAFNFIVLFPRQIPPVLIDLPRVMKFLLLPSFLVIAIWLSHLEKKSQLVPALIIVFIIFNGINYDGLVNDMSGHPTQIGRMLRHQVEVYSSTHGGPLTHDQKETRQFLLANEDLAKWIKAHTLPNKTLIHTSVKEKKHSSMMLRTFSERSITYAYKDGGLLYYTNKPAFIKWGETLTHLDALRDRYGYCSQPEILYAREMKANLLVCETQNKPPALVKLYENEIFALYRI